MDGWDKTGEGIKNEGDEGGAIAVVAKTDTVGGAKGYDGRITAIVLWSASLTAVFTTIVLIVLLRVFGLLSLTGTVDFRGAQRSIASVQKLQQVWDALSRDFYEPVDEDRMIEYAAAGMVRSVGDVYTVYYTKDEMTQFTQHSAGVFHGVGVYVTQGENGRLRITGFLENSPAQEAGVEIDDEIISVDGEDVTGITDSNIVINMIKGEAGVFVTIGFYRPSDGTAPEFDIERREIKTDNIFSHIVYTGEDGESGMPVGYIYIKMFDGAANEYFNRHLDRLLEQGVEALVIDLRGNPGGDYEETVKIADRLIGEGIIVYTEDRAGRREYRESGEGALDMPIRVLIDG
ncbi:MAG: S41 family peptidase, partial [Oscillospiraceae bacterium]|nr:S41 family peptidase [Oscillospiraceae bacterium]